MREKNEQWDFTNDTLNYWSCQKSKF